MNCIFLSSIPISHIIPVESVVKFLLLKKVNVYIFSSLTNKKLIESYGATFMEYPFDFIEKQDIKSVIDRSNRYRSLLSKGKYAEGFNYFIEKDVEYFYTHTFENLELLFNKVKHLNPDFIIRDAVDRYGSVISKMLDIPCVGLLTHTLYSKSFFEKNPQNLYKIFMNAIDLDSDELNEYLKKFRLINEKINEKIFLKSSTFKLNTHHQFDPNEKLTLINSTPLFQPKESFEINREYLIIPPSINRLKNEENIDTSLKVFIKKSINKNNKIVYIASGSMLSFKYEICIDIIDRLINNNLSVIMSNNKEADLLKKHYLGISDVYIDKFIPQQYVLSNSSLFITTGGQNSIIESIYHMVPMLAIPVTSEQKMNSYLIEKNNIGRSTYIKREKHKTIGVLIRELLYDRNIRKKIKIFHDDLINNKENYDILWRYINEKR